MPPSASGCHTLAKAVLESTCVIIPGSGTCESLLCSVPRGYNAAQVEGMSNLGRAAPWPIVGGSDLSFSAIVESMVKSGSAWNGVVFCEDVMGAIEQIERERKAEPVQNWQHLSFRFLIYLTCIYHDINIVPETIKISRRHILDWKWHANTPLYF